LAEHQITIDVRTDALDLLARRGYDPAFGARPLRRIITNLIEDPMAEGLLAGRFVNGDAVIIDTQDDLLRLRPQRQVDAEEAGSAEPEESAALV
ncbi:MAG: NDP-hexose 4-ketoreductase, partial [Oscillochloris sp.]|nr:NDP-hexose 4-ketoreductase [Oscillochloris sp.]